MNDERDVVDPGPLPEIPDLGYQVIKRAIFRGTLRTIFDVCMALFALTFIFRMVTGVYMSISGRMDVIENVAPVALQVAHPEYQVRGQGCCSTSFITISGDVELHLRSPSFSSPPVTLEPNISVFGHVPSQTVQVPGTRLGALVQSVRPDPVADRKILEHLPSGTNASAVILFNAPLDETDLTAFLKQLGQTPIFDVSLLFDLPEGEPGAMPSGIRRIGWPSEIPESLSSAGRLDLGPGQTLDAFRVWADGLSSGDASLLSTIGLPAASVIQLTARTGVTGVVVGSESIPTLLALLEDPMVSSVRPGEVAFALTAQPRV